MGQCSSTRTAVGDGCWLRCHGHGQALLQRSSAVPVWWQPCLDWGQDHGSCTVQAVGGGCEARGACWGAGLGGGWSWGPCVPRSCFP